MLADSNTHKPPKNSRISPSSLLHSSRRLTQIAKVFILNLYRTT